MYHNAVGSNIGCGVGFIPKFTKKQRGETLKALSLLSQIGVMVVVCVGLGVFVGHTLDKWLGTAPWLLLVFSLLGAASAFKSMFDLSKKF